MVHSRHQDLQEVQAGHVRRRYRPRQALPDEQEEEGEEGCQEAEEGAEEGWLHLQRQVGPEEVTQEGNEEGEEGLQGCAQGRFFQEHFSDYEGSRLQKEGRQERQGEEELVSCCNFCVCRRRWLCKRRISILIPHAQVQCLRRGEVRRMGEAKLWRSTLFVLPWSFFLSLFFSFPTYFSHFPLDRYVK
ncbi:hypothetical protein DFJ73DRAFT_829062 [Zopfochytrium polystomum]|nr:hypothetical protein DFJ73DRAFT_829062 [Zopfochytrium polystomum]